MGVYIAAEGGKNFPDGQKSFVDGNTFAESFSHHSIPTHTFSTGQVNHSKNAFHRTTTIAILLKKQ